MEKHPSKIFIFTTLLSSLTITGFVFVATNKIKNHTPEPTSYASENPPEEKINTKEEILAPDGKYTLVKENKTKTNGNIQQTFSIKSQEDKTSVEIFTKESAKDNLLTVPFNSFAPTNKYLFLEYPAHGKLVHLVLRTDGKDLTKDNQFAEIESAFAEKYADYEITEVTGWGGYNLVVFNTNSIDGKIGPSWWFDATSLSFIRLSTKFN